MKVGSDELENRLLPVMEPKGNRGVRALVVGRHPWYKVHTVDPEVLVAALRTVYAWVVAHLSGPEEQTDEKPRRDGFTRYKGGAHEYVMSKPCSRLRVRIILVVS